MSSDTQPRDRPSSDGHDLEMDINKRHDRETMSFDSFLDELAASFARVPAMDVDREIESWLQRSVELFDADRSCWHSLRGKGFW